MFARRKRILGLVILLGLLAGAWPASRWWHKRQTVQYKAVCRRAVETEDWDQLATVAREWTSWDPAADDGWVFLAEAALQQGELEPATDFLGRVRDEYHGALQALAIRADVLFSDLDRPYAAADTWHRMLRINPRADLARQRLIYFHAMLLQRAEMVEHIREAMRLGCEPPEAYTYLVLATALNFSDGLVHVTKWRATYPDDEALEVAQAVYMAKNAPSQTMAMFGSSAVSPGDQSRIERCLEKYPDNLEVLAYHLETAIFDGDADRVAALLSQAPPEAEQDARFWRFRSWYLMVDGEYAEAESAVRQAIALHPFDWRSHWQLADVLRRLERRKEADEVADLAHFGKQLERKLLEQPSARDIAGDVFEQMHEYIRAVGDSVALRAIERRRNHSPLGFLSLLKPSSEDDSLLQEKD